MEEKTPLQKVVDIFNEYFGEERVDLQGNTIMVYYPTVTITNENDRSVELTELYVRVLVGSNGKLNGTFSINRSEYTAAQWLSDYSHSHIPGIPKSHPTDFLNPCLGTGPIRDTCATLNTTFDEDIWRLFVFELDKYVHTESLNGGPYMRMERIGIPRDESLSRIIEVPIYEYSTTPIGSTPSRVRLQNEFLPYLIRQRILSFNYINGYGIADYPLNTVIKVSNCFIEWFNNLPAIVQGTLKDDLFNEGSLIRCKITDSGIHTRVRASRGGYHRENPTTLTRYIGTPLWSFKGNVIHRNITNIPTQEELSEDPEMDEFLRNSSILLHPNIVMDLINRILRVINFQYGREREENSTSEETYYI